MIYITIIHQVLSIILFENYLLRESMYSILAFGYEKFEYRNHVLAELF